jgi:hydroxymethylpyrimidine/phosphomethylpyrimidine kinase
LLANGHELQAATAEALTYLDHSLEAGFHPGMGHIVPDRLFWAQAEDDAQDDEAPDADGSDTLASNLLFELPPNGTTKH